MMNQVMNSKKKIKKKNYKEIKFYSLKHRFKTF